MITEYKKLKAGDVRQERDEVRRTHPYPAHKSYRTGKMDKSLSVDNGRDMSDWSPTQMVGHKILQSDLIVAEFRRSLL